ncbi:Hint domain-containing protein [Sinisalibacter aestuarii]|uniref:Hedgehog/Intein (Hint) domain-containing protein n=1 Tax=Sinisalibacter aestuarii TaxID=2949426 RepID=A0ABQ5LWX0_9RHOB|nr:Hint domain-containing protein [Sinisalibacter aestuarii]GKY89472.1 hypothetical protein STA1M1_33410 [Sinisalibacter aestuarii]
MTQVSTGGARRIRVALPLKRAGFGPGTGILTTDGELPVEFLEPGDRVVTLDRGAVPLARVIVHAAPAHQVVRLRPSVLDQQGDGRSYLLAARQQIVLRDWRARIMFGKRTALVEAGRLVDGAHISRLEGAAPTRLFELAFDDAQHVIQIAGGTLLAASARLPVQAKG